MIETLLDHIDRGEADRPALSDAETRLTYAELRARIGKIGNKLHQQYGGGRMLLVPATSDARFVATLLGVMASGNTPIPIDPALPEAGVEYIRTKSNAAGIVAPPNESELAEFEPADFRDRSIPAMILFTSGTSGYPKGVIISHAGLGHSCQTVGDYLGYGEHSSAAVALPLHYSYALLSQVCCMLHHGGHIYLFDGLRNPLKFSRIVNEQGLETFCGVPSTYLALCVFHEIKSIEMPSVRVLCSAGAAMDRSRYETVKTIFPNAEFFNNYGMTEAAPRISFISDQDPRFREPTCGRAMNGVEVRIVDPETHQPRPDGETGMLVVRGPNITAGYLDDPELTRAAFTKEGYLISGDIAHKEGNYIFISGRHDDIFNIGGEKIAPLEIENVLNRHEAVELSAVVGVVDPLRGKVPVAFVKLTSAVTRKELVQYLEGYLPKVKVPLRYVEVNAFPMTANGKLQRRHLSPDDADRVERELD